MALRLEQRSWIYDEALAVFTFIANNQLDKASDILRQLAVLQEDDGTLAFSYDVYRGQLFDQYVRSGALAWVGSAALAYEECTGDPTYRSFASKIGDYLLTQQVTVANGFSPSDYRFGSVLGGYGSYDENYDFVPGQMPWASTEHNIDSYFFLRDLGYWTSGSKYATAADLVKQSLLNHHWNSGEERFNQGISASGPDTADALDIGSWGGLFLLAVGEQERAEQSAQYLERFRVTGATIEKSSDPNSYNQTYTSAGPIDGYKPYDRGYVNPPNVVWAEGTIGAALFKMRLGQDVTADLQSMKRLQAADPEGGFVQVTRGSAALPYEFHVWPSVGGTAWAALLTENPGLLWHPDGWSEGLKQPVDAGGPTLWRETAGGGNPSEVGSCNGCYGDPVQIDTGALLEAATDVAVTDRGDSLSMSRTYSSAVAVTSTVVGYGWSWPYGMNVWAPTDPSDGPVVVTQENGSTATFSQQPDGTYKGAPRLQATLLKNGDGSWTFVRKKQQTFQFDAAGKIQSQSDRNGGLTTYSYNTAGRLSQVRGPSGRALAFTYDDAGYLATVTTPLGATATYTHDAAGNLTSVADPVGGTTNYSYDEHHLLTEATTPRGGVTANVYDGARRVTKQTDPLGRDWTFTYADGASIGTSTVTVTAPDGVKTREGYVDGQRRFRTTAIGTTQAATTTWTYDPATSQPTTVTGPDGALDTYAYDASGNTLTHTDPLGRITRWTYNDTDDQLSQTNTDGKTTTATYDGNSNLLSTTTAAGRTTTYTYNPDGTRATAATPGGNETDYGYLPNGDLASVTDPLGRTTSFEYNADGRLAKITDPANKTTTNTVDNAGRITKITDPLNHATSFTYNGDGYRTSITNANGYTSTTIFDLAGQLTKATDQLGNATTFTYTPAGLVSTETDPEGDTTSYAYDLRGNQISSTDPIGRTTSSTYDIADRLLTVKRPSGAVESREYNIAGELTKTIDAKSKGTTQTYDQAGRLATITDPIGRVTSRTYDADGRLTKIVNPDLSATNYEYDPDGNLTKVINPDGAQTNHTFNGAGQTLTRTLPGGLAASYSYDPAGRVVTITAPDGSTTTRTYDGAGRVTNLTYSNANPSTVTFTYDNIGQRTSRTDGTGTTTYEFDHAGRRTSTTDGSGNTVGYAYDKNGRFTRLTYPGGQAVTYDYDAAGQMTTATDWAGRTTQFSWTDDGDQATQTTPNGVATTNEYDPNGQITNVETRKGSTTIGAFTYAYNAAGEVVGTDTPSSNQTYTYSPTSQIASVDTTSGSGPTGAYTTTPGGQLTGLPDGATLAYNDAHQLTTITPTANATPTTYQFDPRGNRSSSTPAGGTATTYEFDQTNHLTAVTLPAGRRISYSYDSDGLRHARSADGATKTFVWATAPDMPLLLDDGTHRYLYGPSLTPYAQMDTNGSIEYLHSDRQGTVTHTTNSAGSITATDTYDVYGTHASHVGASHTNIGYTGAWTDPDTGLIYLRTRDYDPASGQFLSIDPAVDVAGSPYSYVGNNPLKQTDPSGLCADCNWLENLVLKGPSEEDLTTGFTGGLVNLFTAIGDNSTFGLTTHARKKIAPGYACRFNEDSLAYQAGSFASILLPIPGGKLKAVDGLADVGKAVDAASLPGYRSFSAAKRALGSPGTGKVYDHVVEQSQIRRSGFRPQEIHHPFNLNPVPAPVNQIKANYYSSKKPFTGGRTVREWLSGQSFADQYRFGMDVLTQIRNGTIR